MMKRFLSTTSSVSQLGSGRGRRMIKVRANRPIVQNQRKRNAELNENAKLVELDWRIVGATIIHRYPVISADLEDWEEKWYDLQEKISERRRAVRFHHEAIFVMTQSKLILNYDLKEANGFGWRYRLSVYSRKEPSKLLT